MLIKRETKLRQSYRTGDTDRYGSQAKTATMEHKTTEQEQRPNTDKGRRALFILEGSSGTQVRTIKGSTGK